MAWFDKYGIGEGTAVVDLLRDPFGRGEDDERNEEVDLTLSGDAEQEATDFAELKVQPDAEPVGEPEVDESGIPTWISKYETSDPIYRFTPPPRGLGEELGVGVERGIDQTQALGFGLIGLMGESLGVEAVSDLGIDGYVRNMEEAAENMASVQDPFEEIGGVGDAGLYAAGVLGEQIPQLLLSLAGGGVGGFAAKTVAKKVVANEIAKRVTAGMAKDEAEEVVAKLVAQKALQGFANQAETQAIQQATRAGALGGAYTANVGQIAGGSFGEIEQETGLRDPVNALGFALLGGALETGAEALMLAPVASKLIGRPSAGGFLSGRGVENATAGMAVGPGTQTALRLAATPPTEGLTEYSQTFTEQAAVASADPNRTLAEVAFTPEAERERQIAGAAGVVAGGGFGAVSQAASYLIPETAKAVQRKLQQRQTQQGTQGQEQDATQQRIEAEGSTWSEPQTLQGYTFRQNERGQLAIFNPDPEEFKGLPQFSTPDGQTFVPLFGVEDSFLPQKAIGLAFKARGLFDDEQADAAPAPAARKTAPQKPAVETTLDEGPDLTPAAQAVGARARFSGYEGTLIQDGERFLLRADPGTNIDDVIVPGYAEVEVVPAPAPTQMAAAPIPEVQTPTATQPETPAAQPEPLPDMAAMGAEEISRAALARPEVSIIDRAAEAPDEMDANAVSLLRDARTTLEDSINEIESRDLDAETKSKLTTPLYEKFIKADDTLGKVPADATTQLDREIERKRQEAEQAKVERAKVAAQTVNRPPSQSEQFVNSLKQGDGVTIYLSGDQAPDALSFNGRFERKRNDGTVFVTTEPDAEGKTQRMAFRPSEYNRIGMLRPAPPKESPVESAVKSVLGPKPTKAKAERVLGTPYTQGEAQPVFLDDGLYQNPGKSNKVPAVVRYFDKPGEPGVKEVVTFGQWNGNKRSTPFVTVRQMSEGLDVPVPDSDLQNLPQGVQVEPRVMKNGQTANVVTKVEYQGNVYRRGDTAYDFSVNGRTTGPGGFREIYLNSPERLARSERARRGKETSKAKPSDTQSMLDGLDEADQFFVSDARARAAQFIDRRTDLDDEAKKMAADEADASIIEQIASRTKRGVPPVSDLALFKRFNNRMLDIFESNQENETETNVDRDVQEAARQISDELVADGRTPQEAKAAVDPIVARWQSYGSFSPIKTAMTKVQSAKKAAVRSGQNRRAAEADIAAGTVGQARRTMTPAERFNERTTDEAMAARERSARLTAEDRDLLRDFNAQEELSESDLQRVEDLLQYIQGNTPYDQIYPTQPAGSPTAARAGALPGQPGSTDRAGGQVAGRQPAGVGGVTESRGRGRNQAGRGRGRDRVGGTDGGQTGTVPGAAPVGGGRPGVAGTPNQRNASAARRAFLGSFIRNQDLVATLPEAVVERIYQAVSTTLDALAATRGRRVVASVQPNMADLLGMSVRDLVAGYREEFTSYQANRERVDAIRTNAEQAVRTRLFEGPQAALEFIAQDQDRPAFMRLIAQTMLNQAKRFGIDLNNIAMQVGIFRRQPPTGAQSGPAVRALVEEVEGAFNVTTPDGVETFEFGEGIGMTRKQAGKAARARAYDIVTGQTRTSWAGVLGVNPLAETAAERYSAVLNLDNWHEGNDIGLTMLHEISHIFSETKFEGRENLNAVEKAAIKGLESFRVRMLKAVARANGLEVPSGNNPADLAQLSRRIDDLSNPNVAGADADRRLAYLVSPNETARGLMESPEFLELAIEVGLGDTRKRQNAVELTGPLAEAWNDMTELEAGRKVDPTSPLGRAFKDAWSATFGALEGATEGYVKPPVGSNPLAQELSALNEAADFIEEQVAARGLDGTTAERDALLQEFMASRNMVQGAETTDAVVDEDVVDDPVTMSRAVDPSDLIQVGMRVRVTARDANGTRFNFFARPGTDSTILGAPVRVFEETDRNGATVNRTRVVQADLIENEQPLAMSKTYGEWVPAPATATESRALSSNESRQALSNQGATNDRRNEPALQTSAEGMGSQGRGDQVQRQTLRPNAEPNPFVQDGVSAYNARYGLGEVVRGHYAPVDEQRARQIAAAYDALPVLDRGAATQEAYGQLAREIQQQWDFAINDMGITFEPWTQEGQPYANSREMVRDVRDNRHLWFFTGGEPHPLLNQPDADGLTMNDKLRAIHDLFGHAAEDYQFGARGEENAWIKHSQMFTPLAQRALTTETRGQNSWVNYGSHNYGPDGARVKIPASERPFATQKVALLPEEYMDWQGALAQSPTESRALAMETSAVEARLQELGFPAGGIIRVVNEPDADFEGRTIILDGKVTGIELNAAAMRDNATIDRVLNHEFAESANADGALNRLVERLTPKEKKEINDTITRLRYEERARSAEEAARAIETLAEAWKGRGFFTRAVARVEAWASKLGFKLTRRAAEYIAARNLADINAGFRTAYNRFINVRGEAREGRAFVTPEENARFLELAKDPEANREKLQKMVDEAAKRVGYVSEKMYHGTAGDFTVFDPQKTSTKRTNGDLGDGFYFTPSRKLAENYSEWAAELNDWNFEPRVVEAYLGAKNTYILKDNDTPWNMSVSDRKKWTQSLKSQGYDSLYSPPKKINDLDTAGEFVVFENTQIKSADPVTYDDQGNVIPLEQRFQPTTPDIRYARREVRESRREPEAIPTFTEGTPEAATLKEMEASMAKVDAASEAKGGKPETYKISEIASVWMDSGLGESTVTDAIGDWADGAEPTTLTEHFNPDLTYEDVEVMAALKGAIRNQKAVIPFKVDDNGSSFIYDFFIPNQTAAQARDILGQAGIEFRTLIEQNGGTRVLVFDKDGSIEAAFTDLVQNNNYAGTYYKGTGDFLGSWDSRQEGREIYARTVGRRVDQIRLEERQQGAQGADSLRATRLSELAAEAGLTLTESRATAAPTNENRDPYFGNESSISRGPQEGGPDPSRPTGKSQRIARSVYEAGGAIRDAALRVLEEKGLVRRNLSARSEKEIRTVSRAIARYLVATQEQLDAGNSPAERALADAVRSFREKVPLIPKARIEELITSEADPLAVLDTAVDRFESGIIPEDRFGRALGELARRYGVTIGSDLDAAVATLRGYFEENPSAGATWVIEGQGAESKAYKDDNNVIYKVAPVRDDLLSVAPIGRGSLTITDKQAPFFDRDGRMPIFDRLLAANNLPIHTPTEIIGFVDDGRIVIKQPYLEKAEPEAGELVTRAKNSGVAVLPAQKEDPKFGGDINTAPLVFRIDGEPWLALDFNPRNSRMFNGTATPFDLIFRKLTDKDIAANKDIKQAVERLPLRPAQPEAPAESRARGRVWRPITKTTPTGGKISQGGMFSVDELLDKQAGDAYRSSRMAIKADVSVIQELSRQLERQMKSLFKGQTPPLDTINTALGNLENPLTPQQLDEIERLRAARRPKQADLKRGQYLRENRKRFKEVTQPEALAQLPEALAETIREMSAHIESLSRRLPQEGLVNGDLAITIDEALGTYLNRSYAIFDDPNWSDAVRKNAKVMDAARKYIRNSLVQSKVIDLIDDAKFEGRTLPKEEAAAMANDSVSDDQVEGMLESYLAIGEESPSVEVLSGRIPGQKNLSMMIRRGNIAPEIQALWGRYEDPAVNYAKTVMKLSSLVANNQFLTELRDMGLEEGWLWSRENNPDDLRHPPGYVRISSDNNPTLAPIAGMYAHPMLAEGLFKMFPVGSTEEHYWWLRSAMKLTGVSMAMKTVGSVASQIRNYLGNYLNLIATGNLGLRDIASGDFAKRFSNSTDTVLASTFNKYRNATRAEWRAKIDDYIRRGIVGESITTGLLEDLLTASRRAGSPDFGDFVWSKVSEPFKKVADLATKTYSAGDDWFKVMIYEAEQDKYRKAYPQWSDDQVKQKAAEIARDIHWTYSLAPALVQDLKKFPFVAPFVTFTTEVIRTTINLTKLARQEIMEGRATGNKELEDIGWKRVRGMTTAAFLPLAVSSASMALAGVSGEDEEDLRRFLPDWQKNSQLLVFRKADGQVSFVDVSFLDPYEYFKKPLVALTRSLRNAESADEMLVDGAMSMVSQALSPFTSEQIFAGAVMDVMRNQDAAGRQVYNPQDTGANIGTAVARKIFIDPFTPGTFNSLDRIGKAAFGIQSESGRAYGLFNELSSVMLGQRVSEMDAQQALQFKGSRFMREIRDASALFNREFISQGTRSVSDVVSGYDRSNAARRALIDSIRKDYIGAIRLGVPVQRAKAILRDAGLGKDTLKMVTTGIYRPFEASEQSVNLVRSRGKTDRITAYNQARRNAPSREVLP